MSLWHLKISSLDVSEALRDVLILMDAPGYPGRTTQRLGQTMRIPLRSLILLSSPTSHASTIGALHDDLVGPCAPSYHCSHVRRTLPRTVWIPSRHSVPSRSSQYRIRSEAFAGLYTIGIDAVRDTSTPPRFEGTSGSPKTFTTPSFSDAIYCF
jgi:hypothetical protein